MDNYIKKIIEEKFASKKQQKYFYAKASDKTIPKKERKQWSKWAKEYSDDTDFEKIPDKVESSVDEIVDEKGNIPRKKTPLTKSSKGASKTTTDQAVKTSAGQMGTHGVLGFGRQVSTLRYWSEADMSKALGYDKTLGQDADKEQAEKYFKKKLGLGDEESEDRLSTYGYDDDLSGDKVRLIENPKKFVGDYVESVLKKRTTNDDLVKKDQTEDMKSELSPIIKRQITSIKNTLKRNNISMKDFIDMVKDETDIDE
jgi:hypothetical protein